jgi:2-dehydro-3-deoxyphosphooctonate aldolase (KDO 8-P synthase)
MNDNLIIIAGPCVVESYDMLDQTAELLTETCSNLNIELIFKASYKKANRTSSDSFTGIGDLKALEYISKIGRSYGIRTLTDIHTSEEAVIASEYVDILQIPAFLCRQTDLLYAAAETGKVVNIKKGQFMAPDSMKSAAEKITQKGNHNVWLTERGTTFGYHDLVVDYRSLIIMQKLGFPVIYDATHSVQKPSIGVQSGGAPEFIFPLARAAAAAGVDGIFFETHPEPAKAMSDSATQLPLSQAGDFIGQVLSVWNFVRENSDIK